jgi:hypothetical protein
MSYTSQYPTQDADHVKATTKFDGLDYYPYYTTDPTKSLIGDSQGTSWVTPAAVVTNQRFHIDLGSAKIITRIYYENWHHFGTFYLRGAQNFTFWGSNTAGDFADLTYADDGTWVQLTTSQSALDYHIGADVADPKYIGVVNTVAYRYYAFKFADTWGAADDLGVRRIELQSSDPLPPTVTAFTIPATSDTLSVSITTFTVGGAPTAYLLTETADTPSVDDPQWSASPPSSYHFLSTGNKTLYAWAKNAVGISTSLNDSVTINILPVPDFTPDEINLIPIMTSNILPTPYVASASSTYAGGAIAFAAFARDINQGWASGLNIALPQWLEIDFGLGNAPRSVRFRLTSPSVASGWGGFWGPAIFKIQGFNTGDGDWTDLDSQTGVVWSDYDQTQEFIFTNANGYRYYRIYVTAITAGNPGYFAIGAFEMMPPPPTVTAFTIPSTSTSLTVSITTFTATGSPSAYLLTETSGTPAIDNPGWSASAPTNHVFATAGVKTLYAWAKNVDSEISTSLNAPVTITLPTTTTYVVRRSGLRIF